MGALAVLPRRRTAAVALTAGPTAVGLGLVAHILGGGIAPPATVILALIALVSLLAASLSRLRLPSWTVGVASGVVQQALHLLLTALAGLDGPLFPAAAHVHGVSSPQIQTTGAQQFAPVDLHVLVVTHMGAAVASAVLVMLAVRWAAKPPRWRRASSGLELA